MRVSKQSVIRASMLAALLAVACTGTPGAGGSGAIITLNGGAVGGARLDQIAAGTATVPPATGGGSGPGPVATTVPTPTPQPTPTPPPPPTPPPVPSFTLTIDRTQLPPILELPDGGGLLSGENPDRYTFRALATKILQGEAVATRDILTWSVRTSSGGDASPYVRFSGGAALVGVATNSFTLITKATTSIIIPVTLKVEAASGSLQDFTTFTVGNGNVVEIGISSLKKAPR